MTDIELKTSRIQQRIDATQSQVQTANEALDDQSSVEALSKEIEVLQEEKENLIKEEEKYSKSVNYEEVKEKDRDSKVSAFFLLLCMS